VNKTLLMELSLREKIGQCMMVGFSGTSLPVEVEDFIEKNNIGFVILFSRNIETPGQTAELTNSIHSLAKVMPWLWLDQEGGTVVQFKELAATAVSPMGLAASGEPQNARWAARIIGREMNACGIDGVLAPVLDVNVEPANPIIGIRAFADEPAAVIDFASAFFAGLNEGGVAACGKHFPGHGSTREDSHLAVPEVNMSAEYFFHYCYQPFGALAQLKIDALMTGHVRFPQMTDSVATFSAELVEGLLREKSGFEGVVFSDCLEMRAIKDHHSAGEIAQKAIAAGIDVLSLSHSLDFQKEILDRLVHLAVRGIIPEKRIDQSFDRILKLKRTFQPLTQRKKRSPQKAQEMARSHIRAEQEIADAAVTLLRNRLHLLPIRETGKVLVLEWQKVKATMLLPEAEESAYLAETARQYFGRVDVEVLKLDGRIPAALKKRLPDYSHIICGLYSRAPEIERIQAKGLTQILRVRRDVIAVALGNPYDIRHFPSIGTYIVTYGFRKVQIEALFRVLSGRIKPTGKLPVEIKDLFPRGFGLSS
jgi:beta-N-acetylhexosaminidase